MRVVVTGALGHIGSRLVREIPFAFPDAEVVMVDNLSTQRYASLFSLPPNGKYRFIEADILTSDLTPIFEDARIVVHLAAMTNASESFRMREQVELINVVGTQRVAEACSQAGCSMIFTSTTSVYGKSEGVLNPQSPYAHSKLKAEESLQKMGEKNGLPFIICRFGTVFGVSPGMQFHTAVNKFCWQAALRQPITVWRTALDQTRPYLELGDAVRALQFIMKKNLFDRKIYNVLTTHATVRDIIHILSGLIPDVSIETVEAEGMNSFSSEVSMARFTAQGFKAQGNLKDGILEILQLLQSASRPARCPKIQPTQDLTFRVDFHKKEGERLSPEWDWGRRGSRPRFRYRRFLS